LQIEGKRGEMMAILEELPTVELLDTLDLDPAPNNFWKRSSFVSKTTHFWNKGGVLNSKT
jgi:hypothetical protein